MPTITRHDNGLDISIHYKVIGEGEPLVMHHGNGNCINDWQTLGFVDALSPYFKLILIDSRGYGQSSKPHSPEAYSLKNRADDTIAVLDAAGVTQAHCFGGSIGASMCFLLARFYPERFKSYIFATPYFELFDPSIRAALAVSINYFVEHLETLIGTKISNEPIRKTILANDALALAAANASEWFDYHDYIHYIKAPSLIYAGAKEPSIAELTTLSKQLPDNTFVVLPDLDHAQTYWRADLVAPIIREFITELTQHNQRKNP